MHVMFVYYVHVCGPAVQVRKRSQRILIFAVHVYMNVHGKGLNSRLLSLKPSSRTIYVTSLQPLRPYDTLFTAARSHSTRTLES